MFRFEYCCILACHHLVYFFCREANETALKEIEAKREDAATNAGDMEVLHYNAYALNTKDLY